MSPRDQWLLAGYGLLFTGTVTLLGALFVRFVAPWPPDVRIRRAAWIAVAGVLLAATGTVVMFRNA